MRHRMSSTDTRFLYESLFQHLCDAIIIVDAEDNILQVNEAAKKLFLLNGLDDEVAQLSQIFDDYEASYASKNGEVRLRNRARSLVAVSQYPLTSSGKSSGKAILIRDLAEQKRLTKTLLQERERAQVTLRCVKDAVIITDLNGMVDYLNPAAEMFTGWSAAEAHGLALAEVFTMLDEATRWPLPDPVEQCLREGRIVERTHYSLLIQRDGRERSIEYTTAPLHERDEDTAEVTPRIIGAILVCRDVSTIVGMTRQIAYQASHDALTGLINRRAFETCLTQTLSNAKRERTHHVLCYLDLDQFKVVNDTCGHVAGDQLLQQLTALLYTKVRHTDILSRLGGDEFGVILQDCPMDRACQIAEELRGAIKDFRFTWQEKSFDIGVSIGLVPVTTDNRSLSELFSAADFACYMAKEQGRNRIHVYQPDDKAVAQRHGEMQWVHRITRALSEGRFCLYHQTILPLRPHEGRQTHAEVLVRMLDEQGVLVPPMAFIPAAERYNLMPAIDRWVIRAALNHVAHMPDSTDRHTLPLSLAINVSGQSLGDDGFLEFVIEQFQQSGVMAERVCFEITETAAIANLSRAIHFITSLREIGCQFALDDFGNGLSSFAYLKQLPVDYLKIDGSFVKGMLEDPVGAAMVEAINQVGHVMGIQTIAEFVENEATIAKLRELGVDYAQGYAIDKPSPLVLPREAR